MGGEHVAATPHRPQARDTRRRWPLAILTAVLVAAATTALLALSWRSRGDSDALVPSWLAEVVPPSGAGLGAVLVARAPGTPGHAAVREKIVSALESAGWDVAVDDFAHGGVPLANIVATLHADAGPGPRVVLAAHYDTKASVTDGVEHDGFVGATDAGWSVALLVALGRNAAKAIRAAPRAVTVQLVFFDGEETQGAPEASQRMATFWRDADALLGSRRLAAQWAASGALGDIEVLVLLDLLGAEDCRLQSVVPASRELFAHAAAYERAVLDTADERLRLARIAGVPADAVFAPVFDISRESDTRFVRNDGTTAWALVDDHVPFAERGVRVLPLVAMPFPRVWHTSGDNASALDAKKCAQIACSVHLLLVHLLGSPRDL